MRRISKFIAGAFLGAFIGSTIIILLAPESGEETREAISTRIENLVKQIRSAAAERRAELIAEIEKYKDQSK